MPLFVRTFVFGITILFVLTACGGSGDGVSFECPDGGPGEDWVWTGRVCRFITKGFNSSVSSIAPALDGSDDLYAVGGFKAYKKNSVEYIARLNNNGSLDRGFDSDVDSPDSLSPKIIESARDGSGDVYVGGRFYIDATIIGIARLNLNGNPDKSFNTGTEVERQIITIAPAIDGSGDVYIDGPIRLNVDGSRDVDFNPVIKAGHNSITPAADGSGDIYVSRSIAPYIARLNNDGSIDTGFDAGPSGLNGPVTDSAVATDGSDDIYVVGNFGLVRLNSDGSRDAGFVVDSSVYQFQGGAFILPAIDGSGDVYAHATNTNNEDVIRLNNDGSIDTGFIIGEGFDYKGSSPTFIGHNGNLNDAAITTDGSGDIYVAGNFTHYNSQSVVTHLVRLNTSGAIVR
jgi:uncharacterized delta-60 repeat protein